MAERAFNGAPLDWPTPANAPPPPIGSRHSKERAAVARFPLVAFDQIRLSTTPRYRVSKLLPIHGLTVIWGPPKCGKSFLAFDMLMHVALGWDYQGHRVEPGTIVYCALEGQKGFEARKVAFEQAHLETFDGPVPFYLMPASFALVADAAELIAAIRAQLPDGEAPGVVCLDTLNRSFTGSESDDRDMTAYVRAADSIRDAFGCLVVIVHHCGLEGTRPRGHSALAGAVDAQLAVKKLSDGMLSCAVELMKDGPDGETITCRLERVEVGVDDTGEAITSCIVRPERATNNPALADRPRKPLRPEQRVALEALSEALIAHGKPAPHSCGAPVNTNAVHRDAWREELFRRGVLDRAHSNPSVAFGRLRTGLAAVGAIAERDELIWRPNIVP